MQKPWRDRSLGDGPLIHTSLTAAETAELQRLASGNRCLEVGAAFGYSTVAMAQVASHVVSVDPHEWLNSYGPLMANLNAYRVGAAVDVLREPSGQALPRLEAAGLRFGLVFIDGDHEDAAVAHDVGWGRKLLAPGGVLACDDYDEVTCPGVRSALDRLLGPPPILVDTLAIYEGLS